MTFYDLLCEPKLILTLPPGLVHINYDYESTYYLSFHS